MNRLYILGLYTELVYPINDSASGLCIAKEGRIEKERDNINLI